MTASKVEISLKTIGLNEAFSLIRRTSPSNLFFESGMSVKLNAISAARNEFCDVNIITGDEMAFAGFGTDVTPGGKAENKCIFLVYKQQDTLVLSVSLGGACTIIGDTFKDFYKDIQRVAAGESSLAARVDYGEKTAWD